MGEKFSNAELDAVFQAAAEAEHCPCCDEPTEKFPKAELDAAVRAAKAELSRLRAESETDEAKHDRLIAEGMSASEACLKIVLDGFKRDGIVEMTGFFKRAKDGTLEPVWSLSEKGRKITPGFWSDDEPDVEH